MGMSESVTVVVLGAGPAAPPGVHVLAHADEPRHAPRLVAAARPQVVLVGLGRDRDAVLAVVSELTVRVPDARVLAVSGTGDPAADVLAAVRAGREWIPRHGGRPGGAGRRRPPHGPGRGRVQPGAGRGGARGVRAAARPPARSRLTEREADVLRLVVEGLTARQIATRLVLSPRTVEHHIQRVLRRLGVPNRAALVRRAVENGLV